MWNIVSETILNANHVTEVSCRHKFAWTLYEKEQDKFIYRAGAPQEVVQLDGTLADRKSYCELP